MRKNTLLTMPSKGKALAFYSKRIRELDSEANGLDFNLGRIRWLQGQIYLMVKKRTKHGQWNRFVASTGKSISHCQHVRKIAETITDENSHKMTYLEMLKTCYPSFRKDLNSREQKNKKKKRKSQKKSLRIDKLVDSVRRVGVDARNIVDATWLDSHREAHVTNGWYDSCLTHITATERDLKRIRKEIETRKAKLSSKAKPRLKAVA